MVQNHNPVNDKRREPRYPAHRSSIVKKDNERFYTTIVNFSASGVGFLSGQSLEIGEEAELDFEVEVDGELITYEIPIIVVRCDFDDFEYCIGAALNHVTFEYRQLLKKLMRMHEEISHYREPAV